MSKQLTKQWQYSLDQNEGLADITKPNAMLLAETVKNV